jgi:hypothetical protein
MNEQDYIDLGFDVVEVHQGPDKSCRACEGEITKGDRVRLRDSEPHLSGLYHEACADETVIEYQEDK